MWLFGSMPRPHDFLYPIVAQAKGGQAHGQATTVQYRPQYNAGHFGWLKGASSKSFQL